MITSTVSYYVWKMYNLQTVEAPKTAKTLEQLRVRTKLSVDARMLKILTSPLRS